LDSPGEPTYLLTASEEAKKESEKEMGMEKDLGEKGVFIPLRKVHPGEAVIACGDWDEQWNDHGSQRGEAQRFDLEPNERDYSERPLVRYGSEMSGDTSVRLSMKCNVGFGPADHHSMCSLL